MKQTLDSFFPAETPQERAKTLKDEKEKEKLIIEKIKESHAKLNSNNSSAVL